MKKNIFYGFITISTVAISQNCQEIEHYITSSSHSQTIEVNETTGDTTIYYDLCIGEELTLVANATFPENNTGYNQTLATTEFTWFVNETEIGTGADYTETYTNSGGSIVAIISEDVNGCENLQEFPVYVRVSTGTSLNLSASPSTLCPNVEIQIGKNPTSDVNINVDYQTGEWGSIECEDEIAEPTFLPDGSGDVYTTSIELECFGEGQTLTDVNDIISIDINMEHSYIGDLDIYITAPNGVQVQLFDNEFSGFGGYDTWLGEATDDDITQTNPGLGYDYGWSMNPTYNGTMEQAITNGNTTIVTSSNSITGQALNSGIYLPIENFNALLGTPLNGEWTITVVDNLEIDNGWIFSWAITINEQVIPSYWEYNNFIVDEYWAENPTIVTSNGTDITIFPTTPGIETYSYIIEDNFGCTYTEDLNLTITTPVEATATITNDICGANSGEINLTINGGTPNYNVDWNNGQLFGQNIQNVEANTYDYTITDAIGCQFMGSEEVVTETIELEFTFDKTNDICDDEIGQITILPTNGYPPYNYNWNFNNPDSPTASGIGEGSYIAVVNDRYGCEGLSIASIENEELEILLEYTSEFDHCDQDIGSATITPLNGLAPYSYNWDNGFPDDATAYNLNDGEYDVIVTDVHGCEGETTIEIVNIPGPTAYFETDYDTVVYNNAVVNFANYSTSDPTITIASNYWSFGEGTFSLEQEPSTDFNQVGLYVVELTVTDTKGCTDKYYKEVVSKPEYLYFPPTAFSPNGDNKNDVFRPILKDISEDSYELYIFNRWGAVVFKTKDINQGWDGTSLDKMTPAMQGLYTFKLLFNNYNAGLQTKTGTFVLLR
jgi:gliding motility-associated-like protein